MRLPESLFIKPTTQNFKILGQTKQTKHVKTCGANYLVGKHNKENTARYDSQQNKSALWWNIWTFPLSILVNTWHCAHSLTQDYLRMNHSCKSKKKSTFSTMTLYKNHEYTEESSLNIYSDHVIFAADQSSFIMSWFGVATGRHTSQKPMSHCVLYVAVYPTCPGM